jgi:hypothetical protein
MNDVTQYSARITLSEPREFTPRWFQTRNYTVDTYGRVIDADSIVQTFESVFDTFSLDLDGQIRSYNAGLTSEEIKAGFYIKRMPDTTLLKSAFREYIANEAKAKRKVITSAITFCGGDDSVANNIELLKFVKAITGQDNITTATVLAHWLWGIKAKALGRNIVYHILPVIYSMKQEIGKSTAAKKLFYPIKDISVNKRVLDLCDVREHLSIASSLVCFFDEMSGAGRAEVEQLKNFITADEVDVRILGTNSNVKRFQSCSFMGTSNKPIAEMVIDSGMRRFYQIDAQDKLDWDLINNIDYVDIWRRINENRQSGYILEQKAAIAEAQKELETEDYVKTFIDDAGLIPGDKFMPSKEIYNKYTEYCSEHGIKSPLNLVWFMRKLTPFGFKIVKKQDSENKQVRGIKVG